MNISAAGVKGNSALINSRVGKLGSQSGGAEGIKKAIAKTSGKEEEASSAVNDEGKIADDQQKVAEKESLEESDKVKAKKYSTAVKNVDKVTKAEEANKKPDLKSGEIANKAWTETSNAKEANSSKNQNKETLTNGLKSNSNNDSGNNSGENSNQGGQDQNSNSGVQGKLNDLQNDQKVQNPEAESPRSGSGDNSTSRIDEVKGIEFKSDPKSSGERFGITGDPKDASVSKTNSPDASLASQGTGGIGNANGAGSFVNNGIINNGNMNSFNGNQEINNLEQNIQNEPEPPPKQPDPPQENGDAQSGWQ